MKFLPNSLYHHTQSDSYIYTTYVSNNTIHYFPIQATGNVARPPYFFVTDSVLATGFTYTATSTLFPSHIINPTLADLVDYFPELFL